MSNLNRMQLGSLATARNISPSRAASYAKVNTDRQTRHEARARRRRGDWDILEIPTALLWLDDACAAAALDTGDALECAALATTDLWP